MCFEEFLRNRVGIFLGFFTLTIDKRIIDGYSSFPQLIASICAHLVRSGSLAQLVEQRTFNPLVVGSSPARPTKHCWERSSAGRAADS